MINAQPNKAIQERLIEKLMTLPNEAVSMLLRLGYPDAGS
jgi:hypothetical protein